MLHTNFDNNYYEDRHPVARVHDDTSPHYRRSCRVQQKRQDLGWWEDSDNTPVHNALVDLNGRAYIIKYCQHCM